MRFWLNALALTLAGVATAQEPDIEAGSALFQQHCAACHGARATGDGPMTGILSIAPPDLTALTENGVFPLADVVRRIDGLDMLLAHGGPMPLFGEILEGRDAVIEDADRVPVFTSNAVLEIARYLSSLQR